MTEELRRRSIDARCFANYDPVNDNRFVDSPIVGRPNLLQRLRQGVTYDIKRKVNYFDLELRNFASNFGLRSRAWVPWYHGIEIYSENVIKKTGFVSTIDLLPAAPDGSVLLPRCVDVRRFQRVSKPGRQDENVIRLGHFWRRGNPLFDYSYRYFKNSDLLYDAVEILREKGYKVILYDKFVPRQSFAETLSQLDVLAEQFRVGSYGLPAIEALLTGTPVVGYYCQELCECHEAYDLLVKCDKSAESIAKNILIARDVKVGSTAAVAEFHSPKHTVDVFLDTSSKWNLI